MTPSERRHLRHSILIDAILFVMLWERREEVRALFRTVRWHFALRAARWRAQPDPHTDPDPDEFYCCDYAGQR